MTQQKVSLVTVNHSVSRIHLKIPREMMTSFKFDIWSTFSNFLANPDFRTSDLPNSKKLLIFFLSISVFRSSKLACSNIFGKTADSKHLVFLHFSSFFYLLNIEVNSEPIEIS